MTMVGSKIGTKSWSDAKQNEITKSTAQNLNSAEDMQKLGEESVGDVLNKVADPNYVDPSKTVRGVGSDKMDKDAFMKLMLAQMKNQDPTNPLKSHEMAAQLAQFSGLEQMQNMNTTLTEMLKAQKPNESFQALNFIGKSVAGDSAKIVRMKGDKEHEFTYILPDDAKEAELKIRNAEGEIIRKVSFHDLKKGDNKWMWNGKADSGATAPVGDYQFILEAKASNGNKLAVKTDFDGMISGISYTNEGPVLMVGTQAVKMKDVKKIEDPSLKNNGQKTAAPKAPDLKSLSAAPQTEDKGAEEAAVVPSNIMTGVGLSGGMMEKLKKETTPGPVSKPESKHETKKSEPTASERAQASKKPSQRAGNG